MRTLKLSLLIGLVLPVMYVALLGLGLVVGANAAQSVGHRTCFPASMWDGTEQHPDSVRPCVKITRVYEDGSFKAAVSDANGTVRYNIGVGAADR